MKMILRLFLTRPIQGPDVIRSQNRKPRNFLLDFEALSHLLANTSEADMQVSCSSVTPGTPQGWRFNYAGCQTFQWVNDDGVFVYIKYHFIAKRGQKKFTDEEPAAMCGRDPDHSKRDHWDAIERDEEIERTAHAQVMQPERADPDKLADKPEFIFDEVKNLAQTAGVV